jgi:hypothetical protein
MSIISRIFFNLYFYFKGLVNNEVVCRHHFEAFSEMGKPSAEVHLTLKNIEYFFMVEVGVSEEAVQSPDYLK